MNMKAYTIHPPGQAHRVTVVVRRSGGSGKGKALLAPATRDRLLAEAAEGESDADLAADYGLTEAQVRRLRHNHRVKLQALRRDIAARAEPEDEATEVPEPLKLAFRTLDGRTAILRRGAFLLDGRPADLRRIVAAANLVRAATGEALIRYPGVAPLIERACR
ncbi:MULTISPECIES: hypothetical protein [Oceanibaculum]|uniref:Uncharacterized protein n=1 Tax=Oceanibaculum indicum P24 TaxID=1207063 RepID=K2IWJ7_9PROT|nr:MULTISPECIES: hypothetical protein [Oceanibaculum]EKE74856.1 hypothetical protein P24_11922 [Oceanibaculum indicum P24]MCH2394403.1 hypothetical protein [Oceanibaculum sp.]